MRSNKITIKQQSIQVLMAVIDGSLRSLKIQANKKTLRTWHMHLNQLGAGQSALERAFHNQGTSTAKAFPLFATWPVSCKFSLRTRVVHMEGGILSIHKPTYLPSQQLCQVDLAEMTGSKVTNVLSKLVHSLGNAQPWLLIKLIKHPLHWRHSIKKSNFTLPRLHPKHRFYVRGKFSLSPPPSWVWFGRRGSLAGP